jgi:hypothetical protein
MSVSDSITKCNRYFGSKSRFSALCVSQALLRTNRSGTLLQQNSFLPENVLYDYLRYNIVLSLIQVHIFLYLTPLLADVGIPPFK